MLKNFVYSFFLVSYLFLTACASQKTLARLEIQDDVTIKLRDGKIETVKKGESFDLSKDEILIESPGKTSILVIPLERVSNETIQLKMRKKSDWISSDTQNYLDTELERFLPQLEMVYKLMAQAKYDLALIQTKSLQDKFPRLLYLKRIEASCLMLLNRTDEADQVLKTISRDHTRMEVVPQ